MKIYYNNRPLKDIPQKFKKIRNITDHLEDESTTRVTDEERILLSQALFAQEAVDFVSMSFSSNILDTISGSKPDFCSKVEVRGGKTYYALHFKNGIAVKCERSLYKLSPKKVRRHHVATLEGDTSKHKGQLKLF